jgi:hypothetical protein
MRRFVFGGSYIDFDADVINYVTAYSITDPAIIVALNAFAVGLKSGALWSKLDVILPILGTTAAQHRGDLKTATDKVAWFGGVTHLSDELHFDGTTGYGSVDWQAPNLYSRTAAEFVTNITSGSNGWTGIFDTAVFGMQLSKSGSNCVLDATGVNTLVGVGASGAFGLRTAVVESSGTNGGKHYAGSTLVDQQTPLSSPPANTWNYFIGALNQSGTAILHAKRHCNFFAFGDGLTALEVAELNTLVTTFNTAIGR